MWGRAKFVNFAIMDALGAGWQSFVDGINSLEVSPASAIFRLVLSVMLGTLVCSERKRKGQFAGVRTFALISMGSCLAMLLSIYVPQEYMGLKNGDPGRIAAQVITGIGFIGGGAMIQMRGSVRGLTTAAGIWMTAIVGMAVGVGMYVCAVAATFICLLILGGFEYYERWRRFGQESKVINVKTSSIVTNLEPYRQVMEEHGVRVNTFYLEYDYAKNYTEINFVVLVHMDTQMLQLLEAVRGVNPTLGITLSSQVDL